jgi:hypothetical protein
MIHWPEIKARFVHEGGGTGAHSARRTSPRLREEADAAIDMTGVELMDPIT